MKRMFDFQSAGSELFDPPFKRRRRCIQDQHKKDSFLKKSINSVNNFVYSSKMNSPTTDDKNIRTRSQSTSTKDINMASSSSTSISNTNIESFDPHWKNSTTNTNCNTNTSNIFFPDLDTFSFEKKFYFCRRLIRGSIPRDDDHDYDIFNHNVTIASRLNKWFDDWDIICINGHNYPPRMTTRIRQISWFAGLACEEDKKYIGRLDYTFIHELIVDFIGLDCMDLSIFDRLLDFMKYDHEYGSKRDLYYLFKKFEKKRDAIAWLGLLLECEEFLFKDSFISPIRVDDVVDYLIDIRIDKNESMLIELIKNSKRWKLKVACITLLKESGLLGYGMCVFVCVCFDSMLFFFGILARN